MQQAIFKLSSPSGQDPSTSWLAGAYYVAFYKILFYVTIKPSILKGGWTWAQIGLRPQGCS